MRASEIWIDLHRVRNMRQAFNRGLVVGGALAGAMDVTRGALPGGRFGDPRATPRPAMSIGARSYPAPDGALTFDKLSSVFLSRQPQPRRPAQPHPRAQPACRARSADAWASMCPAGVYELRGDERRHGARCEVTPSNCVQCGAITAKGGRLTPPEGGSGPEYTHM